MIPKPNRMCWGLLALSGLAMLTGCLDDVKDLARGALPFIPPSKYIDRNGRKLTRAEAAYYQKLTDLSKATKVNPNDAVAYNAIAEMLIRKGNYTLGKECLHKAIERDKNLSEPHHNLGIVYLIEERYHGAMEELVAARTLSGDDAKIRTRLGQARAGLGEVGEALKEFDEAIALDEQYTPAYLEKARFLYAQHNYGEAAAVCRTALEHIPPVLAAVAQKEKVSTVGFLDQLLPGAKIVEDDTPPVTYKEEAAFDLALCLKAQGSYSEALSSLVAAESCEDGKPDVQLLKAQLQDALGDTGSALATLTLLRTTYPNLAEVPKLIARYYEKTGQTDLAVKTRLEAAEIDQSDKHLQEEAAIAAESKHDRPRMIAVYERIVRLDPDDVHFRIRLAQAYDEVQIRREAAIAWQEVINARERIAEQAKRDPASYRPDNEQPTDYEVRRRAGMLFADLPGFQGKALIQFKYCLQVQPSDPEVHRILGEMYIASKNYIEAERHVRETLKVDPGDAKSHHNLATLFFGQQRYDESIAEYKKALALKPDLDVSHLSLARVLLGQNRREEALPPLQTYCKMKPLDIEARRILADLYRDLNQRDAALLELEAIFAVESENGGDVDDMLKTVKLKWDMGDKKTSISDLEAQIEKHPSEVRFLMAAGRYYSDSQQHIRAIYTWQRILNVVPVDGNVAARNEALTHLSAEYLAIGKGDEAIRLSEQAGKAGEPEGYRRAAELYLKKGDRVKAAFSYKKVFEIKQGDVDSRKQLAAMLQTSPDIPDRTQALALYEEILQLAPTDELAHVNYGSLLADFSRFPAALEQFEMVLVKNPNSTSAHVGRGIVLRKRARYKEALTEYLKAIELDPASKTAYYNAALIYDYYLPDPGKAREYYDKYVQNGGDPKKVPVVSAEPLSAPAKRRTAEAEIIAAPSAETVDLSSRQLR